MSNAALRSALPDLDERLAAWSSIWQIPDLTRGLEIQVSPRLRRSLGRCDPRQGIVRLNPALLEVSPNWLIETLCHEVAHVAAFRLHGPKIRPHGREWAALMTAAGFKPQARVQERSVPKAIRQRSQPRRLYEHRCRVCQARRIARRPFRRWLCRRCVEAGLAGRLEIVSIPASGAAGS
jgi:predicted SprT family Zn-dependent metalloprotease